MLELNSAAGLVNAPEFLFELLDIFTYFSKIVFFLIEFFQGLLALKLHVSRTCKFLSALLLSSLPVVELERVELGVIMPIPAKQPNKVL